MAITSLGVDPDVHNCAFAFIQQAENEQVPQLTVWVVRQRDGKDRDAAIRMILGKGLDHILSDILVVEGQDVRYTGKTSFANPQDICNLALITGAVLALSNASVIYSPLPREWKGTVPKHIKQCRILDELDIEYVTKGGKSPYPVPVKRHLYEVGHVLESDWKDITDAIGLAVWGLEKYKVEQRRR